MCLNCCRLNLRLNYPEFGKLICQYDVICLQETKTDDTDQIIFRGIYLKQKTDKSFHIEDREENLDKFITIMKNDSKFVFCVKVSSAVYKLDEDVLIGVVYIPPEFTSYSSQDAFNDLDFDIRNFSRSYRYISLAGDFNARTAELSDFSVFT